jgi:hypothetical protein
MLKGEHTQNLEVLVAKQELCPQFILVEQATGTEPMPY